MFYNSIISICVYIYKFYRNRSVVAEQQASAGQDPFVGVCFFAVHVHIGPENVSWASQGRVVHGAIVLAKHSLLFQEGCDDIDYWQFRMQLFWSLVDQVTLLAWSTELPGCTFKHEPMHVCTILSRARHFFRSLE